MKNSQRRLSAPLLLLCAGTASLAGAEAQLTLGSTLTLGLPTDGLQVAIADATNDGVADLLVRVGSPGASLRVSERDTSGAQDFFESRTIYSSTYEWSLIGVSDVSGAGHAGIATTGYIGDSADVYYTRLTSELQSVDAHTHVLDSHSVVLSTELVDFDGDGDTELFSVRSSYVTIQDINSENTEVVTTELWSSTDAPGPFTIQRGSTGDFNNDGRVDVLLLDADAHLWRVYTQSVDGTLAEGPTFAAPVYVDDIALTDLNADGIDDLMVMQSSNIAVSVSSSPGVYTSLLSVSTPESVDDTFIAADMNSDGRADIVTRSDTAVYVRLQAPNGTYASPHVFELGAALTGFTVGDLLGSPNPEIACSFDGSVEGATGSAIVLLFDAPCPADVSNDSEVNSTDLAVLLANWGGNDPDFDGSGVVDAGDLAVILAAWGACQ